MKHFIFDEQTLQETARYWVDSGIKTELDDDLIELNEQFFETIQVENQYGDFLKREKKTTYIGLCKDGSDFPDVIVGVSYHRRGREKTFKILDIYVSPYLVSLVNKEYDELYEEYLIFLVQKFLDETDTLGSATKIYARTTFTKAFIDMLHSAADKSKEQFEAAGIEVRFEGQRWLAFNRKSQIK
ncbi:hypothetical protein [Acinetobacter junii]|uniref:hypothetical protein n=1 Tax=Acinetobacter junii TaxID=40215 RepID=UPI0009508FCA|nr:hypothetical protein [Acinetobacter junii]APU48425.1 hypothetical protein BVL33_07910 [Acinetobacter junii]